MYHTGLINTIAQYSDIQTCQNLMQINFEIGNNDYLNSIYQNKYIDNVSFIQNKFRKYQIQENNINDDNNESTVEINNNIVTERPYRHIVQPYSLRFNAFNPSRELPRTPPNNNQPNDNNNQSANENAFSLRLF